jgi:hypothetical protein
MTSAISKPPYGSYYIINCIHSFITDVRIKNLLLLLLQPFVEQETSLETVNA